MSRLRRNIFLLDKIKARVYAFMENLEYTIALIEFVEISVTFILSSNFSFRNTKVFDILNSKQEFGTVLKENL